MLRNLILAGKRKLGHKNREEDKNMGNVSIIARRLSDKYVQYGWSGNGGYFKTVGARLLTWYDSPDMVEYLFGLGQLRHLWKPHSEENESVAIRTVQDGLPHWADSSEQWIFSKIAFVDHGYFYDTDQTWYYVVPGPFRIKMPLTLVMENLDDSDFEFAFLEQADHQVLDEIFSERHADHLEHCGLSREELHRLHETLAGEDDPLYRLREGHKSIFNCFDDWVVIRPDESGRKIGELILRPKTEQHTETIFW